MPMLRIETSAELGADKARDVASKGSVLLAKALGKPEQYVMTSVSRAAAMSMAGKTETPCAFCVVRSIGGLTPDRCKELSRLICDFIEAELGVAPECVYLNFAEIDADSWGWDGTTFG